MVLSVRAPSKWAATAELAQLYAHVASPRRVQPAPPTLVLSRFSEFRVHAEPERLRQELVRQRPHPRALLVVRSTAMTAFRVFPVKHHGGRALGRLFHQRADHLRGWSNPTGMLWDQWGRVGSVRGRCVCREGVSVGSVWGQCGVAWGRVGSVCGVGVGSVCVGPVCAGPARVGSAWGRREISMRIEHTFRA